MTKSHRVKYQGQTILDYEYETVMFFIFRGKRLRLIPQSPVPGVKTADFFMDGQQWEVKSPSKDSRSAIEHAFQAALHQSRNIIFDLRRLKDDKRAEKRILHAFNNSKSAQRLKIITCRQELKEYSK